MKTVLQIAKGKFDPCYLIQFTNKIYISFNSHYIDGFLVECFL